MDLPVLDFAKTMAALPKHQGGGSEEALDLRVKFAIKKRADVIIVLDDDPTGTQTVSGIPVITEHTVEAITAEMERGTFLFYILTNSRALREREVLMLGMTLGNNIKQAAEKMGKRFLLIQRGDSTLRGHFPTEDDVFRAGAGMLFSVQYLIPAFFEGGRYTINDIHYVKEGKRLVPAAQTPFAKDPSFGYTHSNLKKWVVEKNDSKFSEVGDIGTLSLPLIRQKKLLALCKRIGSFVQCQNVVVNATDYRDLKIVIEAILQQHKENPPFFRTSASFIKALLGQPDRPLLTFPKQADRGGLIVVGSHVPKTTAQLRHLRANHEPVEFEVNVRELLALQFPPSGAGAERQMGDIAPAALAQKMANAYSSGQNVLLFTSREVITTNGKDANLNIAATVSAYLENVVAALPSAPAFLLTKGGITSSRIATESLGVKRAMAIGQVQAGVPTWELGPESKFPGLPFIIFPGNVGEEDSLSRILQNTFI